MSIERKLLRMARRQESDPGFEIPFYERILEKSPDFVEALMCLGDLYTKEGLFEKGLKIDQRLSRLRPEDATVFYNLACSYSLLEHIASADAALRRAIDLGYEDFDYLLKDPDLVNLLRSEAFRRYFQELRRDREEEIA